MSVSEVAMSSRSSPWLLFSRFNLDTVVSAFDVV